MDTHRHVIIEWRRGAATDPSYLVPSSLAYQLEYTQFDRPAISIIRLSAIFGINLHTYQPARRQHEFNQVYQSHMILLFVH